MKDTCLIRTLIGISLALANFARGQLPANFPTISVTTNYPPAVASGYVFLANNLTPTNVGHYLMMVTNDGSPVWYRSLTNAGYDFKVLPNGLLHYAQQFHALTYTGGGDVTHELLDETYQPVETIRGGNGYAAEAHDFQMLPNGNVLLVGYYLSEVDMSRVVPQGNPAALVSGAVIQELDAQRTVVFQWRSWDHYPFTSQWVNSTNAVISAFHINCVFQDEDGNLVISTPDWVKKISRQTGEILWHLGGIENEFTFIGETRDQGISHFRSHAINRLPNGHVLLYNNSTLGNDSNSSVHEYALDETNKVATRIWTYNPSPRIPGPFQGNAQRLSNGDTFIGWGGLGNLTPAACTEVADSNVVFQMKFNNPNVISYRAFRFDYPPSSHANEASVLEVSPGNSYDFGTTGFSLTALAGGGGYNRVSATREPYAPVYPLFQGKAPRVLPLRIKLSELGIDTLTANIYLDALSYGLVAGSNYTIAYRPQSGQGVFIPQPTSFNPATGKLSTQLNLVGQGGDWGELILTYPDLADLAFPPLLAQVENYRGVQPYEVVAPKLSTTSEAASVNQQIPVFFSWSPKGLARYFEFELATDSSFAHPILSVPYQTDAFVVWNPSAVNSNYFYRVRTWNEAGASDWSSGAVRTIAPFISLTEPNESVWHRGLSYFIRWNDNIAENVTLELYKAGAPVRMISTNAPSRGAYLWQVPLDLEPGADYSLKISSVTNSSLVAWSPKSFGIDVPQIDAASLNRFPDGRVEFAFAASGYSQITVSASTNLLHWGQLGKTPLTNGVGHFVDTNAAVYERRFYRLELP